MQADFLKDLFADSDRRILPLGALVNDGVKLLLSRGGGVFDAIGNVVDKFAAQLEAGFLAVPSWILILLVVAVGAWRLGWRFGLFALAGLLVIRITGFWDQTMVTLALVFSATLISLVVGVPLGILSARSDRFNAVLRPVLDFMQTMPAFVYLIPAAMLFGLGRVPGILATVVFAMPPVVRLTALGIRQVNKEQVEAGQVFDDATDGVEQTCALAQEQLDAVVDQCAQRQHALVLAHQGLHEISRHGGCSRS